MRLRDLALSLDASLKEPLVLQITRTIATAIRNGRLKPGVALPGSRQLAEELGVHRNTVIAALKELEAEGWIESRQGSGTFVSERLPDLTPYRWGKVRKASTPAHQAGFDIPTNMNPITAPVVAVMNMVEGLPDVRQAPTEAMAKAYQRAIRLHGDELLQYGEPKGNLTFRRTLAAMLSERRGLVVDPEQILVTRGSRMGLDLVVLSLFQKGGVVAVEDPGNRAAWETIQQSAGATIRPIPVDAEGLDTDALEALCQKEKVGMLYLTPHHQYPTTVTLSPGRRMKLLELAQRHRMAILEDDYDYEYHYDSRPLLPLASGDPTGQVIYMSSMSKLIAPGVRLGFLVAPKDLTDRLARVRLRMDWQGDRVLEWSIAELIRDGDLARHIRKVRKLYEDRRDYLVARLQEEMGDRLHFDIPKGGLALWAKGAKGFDMDAWIRECRVRGLFLHPGRHFSFTGKDLAMTRIGFADFEEAQLDDAARRMNAALVQVEG
jgi:GntR family transcriptional regulator/MocR family aminotransferase